MQVASIFIVIVAVGAAGATAGAAAGPSPPSARASITWSAAAGNGNNGGAAGELCPYESLAVAWYAPAVATERGEFGHVAAWLGCDETPARKSHHQF